MKHQAESKTNQVDQQSAAGSAKKLDGSPRESVNLFHHIQQTIGNRSLGRRIQAKLEISQPHDRYEQEADRVADQVLRMPEPAGAATNMTDQAKVPPIQRMCTHCEEQKVARKSAEEEDDEKSETGVMQRKSAANTFLPILSTNLQRACAGCEEEKQEEETTELQRTESPRHVTSTRADAAYASTVVDDVLRSPGQPLDSATRAFFEPRFGYDFGDVVLHTDARAASSAREVDALAYTVGPHVVLGQRHAHDSSEGQRILAHELTHVVQQQGSAAKAYRYNAEDEESLYETGVETPSIARAATGRLFRAATWAAGVERQTWDAADRTMKHVGFGLTPPTLNGSIVMNVTAAGSAIKAPTFAVTSVAGAQGAAATSEASFTANVTNTASYQLDAIDSGPHSVASTKDAVATRATQLGMTPPSQCTGTDPTTFGINGQPNNTSHSAAVLAHERHHASDHQREFGNVIGAWNTAIDTAIAARTKYSGSDAATAEANMWAAVGGTPTQIATNQHNAWMAANNVYHASPAGKAKRPFNVQADASCSTSSMDHTP